MFDKLHCIMDTFAVIIGPVSRIGRDVDDLSPWNQLPEQAKVGVDFGSKFHLIKSLM